MISTLKELQSYTEQRATKSPAIAARVLLRSPGISHEARLRLDRELPGLPGSYLDCIAELDLETVELGTAALRPRTFGGEGLVERLVLANGSANPVIEFLRERELYEVASWETDPICVVRADAPHQAGEVVWVETPEQASSFARMMDDKPYTTTAVRVSPAELVKGDPISPFREGPGYFFPIPNVPSGPVTIFNYSVLP